MDALQGFADTTSMNRWNPDALRLRRHEAKLTQEQVAEACNVSKSLIALWENTPEPDERDAKALAKLLACRVEDFYREVEVR